MWSRDRNDKSFDNFVIRTEFYNLKRNEYKYLVWFTQFGMTHQEIILSKNLHQSRSLVPSRECNKIERIKTKQSKENFQHIEKNLLGHKGPKKG